MSGFKISKLNMFNQMPVQQTTPVGPRTAQPVEGKPTAPSSSIGHNPKINNDDWNNFMAVIGNANPNKPGVLNKNPDAGVVRTFDLTA